MSASSSEGTVSVVVVDSEGVDFVDVEEAVTQKDHKNLPHIYFNYQRFHSKYFTKITGKNDIAEAQGRHRRPRRRGARCLTAPRQGSDRPRVADRLGASDARRA